MPIGAAAVTPDESEAIHKCHNESVRQWRKRKRMVCMDCDFVCMPGVGLGVECIFLRTVALQLLLAFMYLHVADLVCLQHCKVRTSLIRDTY